MPNYSKVQFIAWEIYTGPVYSAGGADHYPGIAPALGDRRWDVLSQCLDISARVAFTKMAMEAAYQNASSDEDTLKIFMAPEFLYRGAAGAYLFDLLNGWEESAPPGFGQLPPPYDRHWGGLFGELRELTADPKFQNWVFVFGTAVGAAFPYAGGRISTAGAGTQGPAAMGWNLSMIQCGGTQAQGDGCYFTEKHLKSGIDFVQFNLSHVRPMFFTAKEIEHGSEPTWRVLDRLIQYIPGEMGGSLFRFPEICRGDGSLIQFGLEICLDHAQAYVPGSAEDKVTGRLARSRALVDIQLVPSCGMSLIESSLALAPKNGPKNCSYAFNCDGLLTWDSQREHARRFLGAHVHLWSGSEEAGEGHPPRVLANIFDSFQIEGHIPVDGSADLSGVQLPTAAAQALQINLSDIRAEQLWRSREAFPPGGNPHQYLWPEGAGFVRVLDAQPLAPGNPLPQLPAGTDAREPDAGVQA